MSKLINFSRHVKGNFLRATLRDDRPRSHQPAPQFLFWFNEQPGLFTPSPALINEQSSSSLLVSVNNRNDRNGDKHSEDQRLGLLQAIHCSVILAVGYSLTHDRQQFSAFYLPSYCPLVRLKEVRNLQAQPLDHDKKQTYLQLEDQTRLCQPFNELSIGDLPNDSLRAINEYQEDYSDLNVPTIDTAVNTFNVLESGDCHTAITDIHTTSDYSSLPSEKSDINPSCEHLNEAEKDFMRLQESIPMEIDTLIILQQLRQGVKGAVDKLRSLASGESSCPSAMFYLAMAYQQGKEVELDKEKAVELYTSAANRGHPEAKYNLGVILVQEGNITAGKQLIEEAASSGIVEACEALGMGDNTEDIRWRGSTKEVDELFEIAVELEDGGDYIMAQEMYKVAVSQGHRRAARRLKRLTLRMSSK